MNHGMQLIEGLTVQNSLVRFWGVRWNLLDGCAEVNQAIKLSEGIEGRVQIKFDIIREENQSDAKVLQVF